MKKYIYMLICVILACNLAACNNGNENGTEKESETRLETEAVATTEESFLSELEGTEAATELSTEESTQVENNTEGINSEVSSEALSEEPKEEEIEEPVEENTTPPTNENNSSNQSQENMGFTYTEQGSWIFPGWELRDGVYYPIDLMPGGERYDTELHAQWDGKTYAEFKAANSYGLLSATPDGGIAVIPDDYVFGSFAIYQVNHTETGELILFCMGM